MVMYKIQTLNKIDPAGLQIFPNDMYQIGEQLTDADGILVRSSSLHDQPISEHLKIVARAGVGVNNIPVDKLTQLGIPVLNAPGANANAVKELVIAGMFLACRNLCQAWDYSRNLSGDDEHIHHQVEKNKKQFMGFELPGKTLGLIGLGNVGVKVANAAIGLGMRVVGYDPTITIKRAWELSSSVEESRQIEPLIAQSDFISLHVPLTSETKNLINADRLKLVKPGTILLNFARDEIIDKQALKAALDSKKISAYICDFPCAELKNHPQVICLPHLGASTKEAEEMCAKMAVRQIRDYLETGSIINSVNFPTVEVPLNQYSRFTVVNANVPNMVAQISTKLAEAHLNIVDLVNKSRGDIAYNVIDVEGNLNEKILNDISKIHGVIKVRSISRLESTN